MAIAGKFSRKHGLTVKTIYENLRIRAKYYLWGLNVFKTNGN
jgi:hypothetical protein